MDGTASNHGSGTGSESADAHDVVATYPDVASARAAIEALERHGVEAGKIDLDAPDADARPLTEDAQRDADMEATGAIGKRAGVGLLGGAIIGAVIGAVLGALASSLFDIYTPVAMALGGALGGAAFGASAGVFYGGASGLPVSEAFAETFDAEHQAGAGAETRLAVHNVDAAGVDEVVQALRGSGPLSLRRADGDGRLTDA